MRDRLDLACFHLVQRAVDALQRRAISGEKILSTSRLGDCAQNLVIELVLAHGSGIAHGHCMDDNPLIPGNARCFRWWYLAARVIAICERDHDAPLYSAALEQGNTQPDGVAKGGLRAGHTWHGLGEQLAAHVEVFSEWDLHKGGVAEDDQPHAVALATRQKLVQDFLGSAQTIHLLAVLTGKILRRHRA